METIFKHAVIRRYEPVSEVDRGPYWVAIFNADGSCANTGTSFASDHDARVFIEGLDMAARLFNARITLQE